MKSDLETKFARFGDGLSVGEDASIEGYASVFGAVDQGGDVVAAGAYKASLDELARSGRKVKMLWQHDPAQPIGVWDEVHENDRGLFVKGRLLDITQRGREAAALIAAGAIDGLSIGYRTREASRTRDGERLLTRLDLWEVSLVTFPMLSAARVSAKGDGQTNDSALRDMACIFEQARADLADGTQAATLQLKGS